MQTLKRMPASLWIFVALFVVCLLVVPRFATAPNFINLGRMAAILALVSIGQGVVILVRGLDFSIGSAVALFSVTAVLCAPGTGVVAAFGLGFLSVLMLGMLNGILIGYLKIPAFLVTLGAMIGVHGLCSVLVGGVPIEAPVGLDMSGLAHAGWLGVPVPAWLAAAGFMAAYLLMEHTVFGREARLIGSNPQAAELAGVAVSRRTCQAYLLNAVLVAVAGAILTSRLGSGQPNLYPELPFEAIAACAIGGIPLAGGKGGPLNAFLGVCILALFMNALVLLNFPTYVQNMLLGVLIVSSVLLQHLSSWLSWSAGGKMNTPHMNT